MEKIFVTWLLMLPLIIIYDMYKTVQIEVNHSDRLFAICDLGVGTGVIGRILEYNNWGDAPNETRTV